MYKNLLKNSKKDLVDEIIKLRENEKKLREELEKKEDEIKDLK
jgi:flagellar basal body-associated protein FliL